MTELLKVTTLLPENMIHLSSKKQPKEDIIAHLIHLLKIQGKIDSEEKALQTVLEREQCMTTGIGNGFAIPHGKYEGVQEIGGILGVFSKGIDFKAMDGQPVFLIVLLITNPNSPRLHLTAISLLTKLFKNPDLKSKILASKTSSEIYSLLKESEK